LVLAVEEGVLEELRGRHGGGRHHGDGFGYMGDAVVGLDSMAMVPGTASMAMALVHILRRLCRGGDGNHLEVLVVGAPMAVVGQD
jgi:hypothetical protein